MAIIALALLLPLGLIGGRLLPPRLARPLGYLSYGWMGLGFVLLVLVAGADVLRLLGFGAERVWAAVSGPERGLADPGRRLFFSRSLAVVAGVGGGLTSVAGVYSAFDGVRLPEVPVKLPRLPAALEGFTLAQLSDIHVGPVIGQGFLDDMIEKTNALKADAIVITGDLVDGSVSHLKHIVADLRRLEAPHGVFFVTGNHEYYSGADEWCAYLESIGIKVLDNAYVPVGDTGPGGATFDLAGIPDPTARRVLGPGRAPDLARALTGRDPDRELVLLAHQPKQIDMAVPQGVGLQLSGHTHGGQIWPFGALVALDQPWIAGHHRRGDTQIYVSRGTGFWGPPMRVGAPAEIAKIVLTRG